MRNRSGARRLNGKRRPGAGGGSKQKQTHADNKYNSGGGSSSRSDYGTPPAVRVELARNPYLASVRDTAARGGVSTMLVLSRASGYPVPPAPGRWLAAVIDDEPEGSQGPAGFPEIGKLLAIATTVVIASAEPADRAYPEMVMLAFLGYRVVHISTSLRHHAHWRAAAQENVPEEAGVFDVMPATAGGVQ